MWAAAWQRSKLLSCSRQHTQLTGHTHDLAAQISCLLDIVKYLGVKQGQHKDGSWQMADEVVDGQPEAKHRAFAVVMCSFCTLSSFQSLKDCQASTGVAASTGTLISNACLMRLQRKHLLIWLAEWHDITPGMQLHCETPLCSV